MDSDLDSSEDDNEGDDGSDKSEVDIVTDESESLGEEVAISLDDVAQHPTPESIEEATPLPRWQNSKAKARLVKEISNNLSDIYLCLGEAGKDYGKGNWSNINFGQIKQKFVDSRWDTKNFKESLKRLHLHYIDKTGPFTPAVEVIEPWYTSPRNVSPAYAMLFTLMMKEESMRKLESMTNREVWESCSEFQKYDFSKFTGSSGYISK